MFFHIHGIWTFLMMTTIFVSVSRRTPAMVCGDRVPLTILYSLFSCVFSGRILHWVRMVNRFLLVRDIKRTVFPHFSQRQLRKRATNYQNNIIMHSNIYHCSSQLLLQFLFITILLGKCHPSLQIN